MDVLLFIGIIIVLFLVAGTVFRVFGRLLSMAITAGGFLLALLALAYFLL